MTMRATHSHPERLGTVLVVDDDPIALEITRERLESIGYDVTTRSAALGTIEIVNRQQPDCVLLDVDMPALSGKGLAELIHRRRAGKRVCVILHSGLPKHDLELMVLQCGADGAIQKTSDDAAFMRAFRTIVARLRAGLRK